MTMLFSAYRSDLPLQVKDALHRDFEQGDRLILLLLILHWGVASTLTGYLHGMYLLGIVGGGGVVAMATAGYIFFRGTVFSRIVMGVGLMTFSAIFIQQSLGQIEFHFHIFAALPILTRYRDPVPVTVAALFVAVHHLTLNYCQSIGLTWGDTPIVVFNYGSGLEIVFLHAAFVVFALCVYLIMLTGTIRQFITQISTLEQLAFLSQDLYDATEATTHSSQSLTHEANRQSVAVEQTSTALEEIMSMSQNTAEHTMNSQLISHEAVAKIEELSQVMGAIKGASDSISNITKTIDGIAFQTNILSLNAAVEAARAGEAGQGFAVVADEVRGLAIRSAEAANDIAERISQNMTQAEAGVSTTEGVIDNIRSINQSVVEIAHATQEQVQGIQQINTAVNQVRQVTEHYATFVETINSQIDQVHTIVDSLQREAHQGNHG